MIASNDWQEATWKWWIPVETEFLNVNNTLLDLWVNLMSAKVLEVWCGRGDFLLHLLDNGVDVVWIDIEPRNIVPLPLIQADIMTADIKKRYFDIVYSKAIFDQRAYRFQIDQRWMLERIMDTIKPWWIYYAAENYIKLAKFQIWEVLLDNWFETILRKN